MNKLKNTMCYLSGPIDFCPNDGVNIRDDIRNKLSKLNICFFDPCNKPIDGCNEVGSEKRFHHELRNSGKWNELEAFAKHIRRTDLRGTDISHFIVAYIDTNLHQCGTYDEIFSCERAQKPIFLILKNGKKQCPLWLFAVVDHKYMFESVDELYGYLQKLDSGEIAMDNKWVLFNKDLSK